MNTGAGTVNVGSDSSEICTPKPYLGLTMNAAVLCMCPTRTKSINSLDAFSVQRQLKGSEFGISLLDQYPGQTN